MYRTQEKAVKQETYGWRDESISRWHRTLPYDLPCCNMDAIGTESALIETNLWIEMNYSQPRFFVEYKSENAAIDSNQASIKCNRNVANLCKLPFLIVRYAKDQSWFSVKFENEYAHQKLKQIRNGKDADPNKFWMLSERKFVELLYMLRDKKPTHNLDHLRNAVN
jgi:hypothetical protein